MKVRPASDFIEPMYLFLDTEVFTTYGLASIESLKDHARNGRQVDWVRSWRLVPDKFDSQPRELLRCSSVEPSKKGSEVENRYSLEKIGEQ